MSTLKNKNLGFFLTEKMSLKNWDKAGILSREIAPYNLLAKYFKTIYLFTYDGKNELKYKKYLANNIEIVYKRWRMRAKDYRWLLPILSYKKIKECNFLKTNQFKCRAALIAKILHPKAKLILRTGWLPSIFYYQKHKRENKKLLTWEKIAYKLADRAITTSKKDKEYLIKKAYLNEKKIKVIPNYIDTKKFKPLTGIKKYTHKIVFIGRIDQQKNLEILIKALANSSIEADIIGPESPKTSGANYKQKLINLAKQQNSRINFLGVIANEKLPEVLNQYKIFVLPSHYEGMPKTLLEAMSCGLAVIGTRVAGIQEVLNKQNGQLVEKEPSSLRQAIEELINDEKKIKDLGQQAHQFIIEHYSLEKQIKKEIEIYENLV